MVTTSAVPSYQIVVIDDDAAVRDSLSVMLMAHGHHVRAFETGKAFLVAQGEGLDPDCVVLDLMMPEMSGYAMLQAMAERQTEFPVIMLTAVNDNNTRETLLAAGAADYLTKPVDPDLLCETINRVVRDRRADRVV